MLNWFNVDKVQVNISTYFKSLVFLLALLVCGTTHAQYSFLPSTTFIHNTYFGAIDYDGIDIRNESADTLKLEWSYVSMDTLPGCVFDLCAYSECYLGVPAHGYFPHIAPGETGWLKMHFWTGNVSGTSTTRVYVFEPSAPASGDTLTFILNNLGPNAINEESTTVGIVLYPNPATDKVNLVAPDNSTYTVSVFNTLGSRVLQTSLTGNSGLYLGHLAKGTYAVVVEDEKHTIKTHKLVLLGQ